MGLRKPEVKKKPLQAEMDTVATKWFPLSVKSKKKIQREIGSPKGEQVKLSNFSLSRMQLYLFRFSRGSDALRVNVA